MGADFPADWAGAADSVAADLCHAVAHSSEGGVATAGLLFGGGGWRWVLYDSCGQCVRLLCGDEAGAAAGNAVGVERDRDEIAVCAGGRCGESGVYVLQRVWGVLMGDCELR